MTSILYKCALFAVALACTACGDDDSEPPIDDRPDGSMDASMDASDPKDASDRDGDAPDASALPDGAIANDSSIGTDTGDAAACEHVLEPSITSEFSATRVPLEALCNNEGCPTLAQYAKDYACTVLEGDASIADFDFDDAGVVESCCFNWWIRTEGCGQVQYKAYKTWPRISNFDADTGALIGRGQLDDSTFDLAGCTNAAFLGGTLLHDCPEVTVSVCDRLE